MNFFSKPQPPREVVRFTPGANNVGNKLRPVLQVEVSDKRTGQSLGARLVEFDILFDTQQEVIDFITPEMKRLAEAFDKSQEFKSLNGKILHQN